jgi:UDP-glucose 4-epimerase
LRYLITGGAGFIGSHLVDALTTRGDSVLVLDDLSTGRIENLQHILESDLVEFVEGSILDQDVVDDCLRSVDACVHLASAVGVKLVVSRPLDSLQRNIRGNDIVISSAARHGRPLLFTSTSEIYGKNSQGALSEESDRILGSPYKLRWSYATAKAYGEALAYSYAREQGAHMKVVRLFNTVGPRQTGAYGMVLPRFVRQALAGDDLTVYGNGTQSRCFGHVLDVVHAMVLLLDDDRADGKVFNIGRGVEMPIIALAGRVIERAGSQSKIRLVPYEDAYDEGFEELGRRKPDTTALEALTGWSASRTVDEAIDDVIAYEQGAFTAQRGLRIAG